MRPGADFISGDKATRKYLGGHAEPEAVLGRELGARFGPFGHGLAIPSHAEGKRLAECLATIPRGPQGAVLTVVVINAPARAPVAVQEANQRSLERIQRAYGPAENLSSTGSIFAHPAGALLVIDRTGEHPLPERQGVGLARKIGADVLLALAEEGRLDSPWIHCSDADATLPRDYFEQVEGAAEPDTAALLYRFRHLADTDARTHEAALQYEISLRYYVLALRFAGSPHAFHSIGSTLALHANAYARVRGFPRREAAEDFHLLNKLAKVGRIGQLSGAPLGLSSRTSFRVPFGTGAAIGRLLETAETPLHTYHPAVFHHLRAWQRTLSRILSGHGPDGNLRGLVLEDAAEDTEVDGERLVEALERGGALARAEQAISAPAGTARRRLLDGFDGLRTLKLVHSLRDLGLADLPLRTALEMASFIGLSAQETRSETAALARRVEALDYGPDKRPAGGGR
ncbi:MAG: hypothetical protein NZ990_04500 [Myxococcota bacterium]|nr:hypothetical protein [Myxococcota bacterium]